MSLSAVAYSAYALAENQNQWVETCIEEAFCFSHPKTLIAKKVQSIDSISGEMANKDIAISYDYGRYSQLYQDYSFTTYQDIRISNYAAQLLIGKREMILVVPKVNNMLRYSMKLEILNEFSIYDAKQLLTSVYFINK